MRSILDDAPLDILATTRGWLGPKATLARLLATRFELDESKVLKDLQDGSTLIAKAVSPQRAQEIQEILARIGVPCEKKPLTQSTDPPHPVPLQTPALADTLQDPMSLADLLLPTAPPQAPSHPLDPVPQPEQPQKTEDLPPANPWAQVLGQEEASPLQDHDVPIPSSKPDQNHIDLDLFDTPITSAHASAGFTHAQRTSQANTPESIDSIPRASIPFSPAPAPKPFSDPMQASRQTAGPTPTSRPTKSTSSSKQPNYALFGVVFCALALCILGALWAFSGNSETKDPPPINTQYIQAKGNVAVAISKALYQAERETRNAEKIFKEENPPDARGMTLSERQRTARQLVASGRAACRSKRLELCEADLSKATELDPANRNAWNALIEARKQLKQKQKQRKDNEPVSVRGASLTDEIQRKLGTAPETQKEPISKPKESSSEID